MNELSPYLRKLLLEHDCAIIPDFGGFVMQRHSAHRATANEQILPPSKTVGFNALLRTEDGLLAHEVCKSRHIPYAQAADFVQQCVRDMKRDLMRGIEVSFDGVGSLHLTTNGNFDFRPTTQTTLTPEYYFLTPLKLTALAPVAAAPNGPIAAAQPTVVNNTAPEKQVEKQPTTEHLLTTVASPFFSRNAYRAFAAMFVVALCFFWSIPLNRNNHLPNNNENTEMFAQLPQMKVVGEVLSSISGEETPAPRHRLGAEALLEVPTLRNVQQPVAPRPATQPAATKTPPASPAPTEKTTEKPFVLVLASQTIHEGATRFVKQLKTQGFETARPKKHNGAYRVLIGHFATRQEAKTALTTYRKQSNDFAEAWITQE